MPLVPGRSQLPDTCTLFDLKPPFRLVAGEVIKDACPASPLSDGLFWCGSVGFGVALSGVVWLSGVALSVGGPLLAPVATVSGQILFRDWPSGG